MIYYGSNKIISIYLGAEKIKTVYYGNLYILEL